MRFALIVVDMLKDNFKDETLSIAKEGKLIIPKIKEVIDFTRKKGFPVIYACDSFLKDDFIFRGKMKPHSIRGTPGAEVIPELAPSPSDMILEKRRFSAFYKTDLDQTLRTLLVDTVVVCGIATHVCVLMTALDGISNDFSVIILEDCCAAPKKEIHEKIIEIYKRVPLYPIFRIMTLSEFIEICKKET